VTGAGATPREAARELATMVARGLLRLVAPSQEEAMPLELDLSLV